MKVLIVEDHPPMRTLIRSMLTDLVNGIIECADGSEVLATYTSQNFTADDCVLMDLEMPLVDGLEATRRLRNAYPDARVIIVTQFGDAHLRVAASQAGACGYVVKENLLQLRELLTSLKSDELAQPSDKPTHLNKNQGRKK